MFSEAKVIEIYCLADDFCKEFAKYQENHMLPTFHKRIWNLILQIVSAIADLFSADEEEIIRMIANDNEKIAVIKKLCTKKNTA